MTEGDVILSETQWSRRILNVSATDSSFRFAPFRITEGPVAQNEKSERILRMAAIA
jgi:hypothetical protein